MKIDAKIDANPSEGRDTGGTVPVDSVNSTYSKGILQRSKLHNLHNKTYTILLAEWLQ